MRIPFAKYGMRELLIGVGVTALGTVLSLVSSVPYLAPLPFILMLFVLYFFRDPNRVAPEVANALVAPADGKIVDISEVFEDQFLEADAIKIGIFLSVFNVHINRAPCKGKVGFLQYTRGKFLNALSSKSAVENESNAVGLVECESGGGKVLVKQIAGVIARRIVCECKSDEVLERGQKFGMIKFGSRTELYVPKAPGFELQVKEGQHVAAGKTILGIVK